MEACIGGKEVYKSPASRGSTKGWRAGRERTWHETAGSSGPGTTAARMVVHVKARPC